MSDYRLHAKDAKTIKQRIALRLLGLFGWRVRFKPLPGPHGIAIVYPHTSNWDFPIGLLAKWSVGIPFRWLGKEALFNGVLGKLFGPLLRSWGGEPVERRSATGAIERLAQRIQQADWYWLAMAPEGTRSFRPSLRSGFYHLAVAAKVPLAICYLDYPRKELGVLEHLTMSGDQETDLAMIRAAYEGHLGLHPELAAPIELAPSREALSQRQ